MPLVPLTIPFTVGCVAVNEGAPTTAEAQLAEERRRRLGLSGQTIETIKTTGEHKEKTHRFFVYVAPTAAFEDEGSSASSWRVDETLASLFYAMVDRVEFVMNASFPHRRRVCVSPPFVIQEDAWGESMVDVLIYLKRAHSPQLLSKRLGNVHARAVKDPFCAPPDAALPIKSSKVVRGVVATLDIKPPAVKTPSTRDELVMYVPLLKSSTDMKKRDCGNRVEGSDEEEGVEITDVDLSDLQDAEVSFTTYSLTEAETKRHAEGLDSVVVGRIRTHLQRPVIDSSTHPALPALRMVPQFTSTPLIPHATVRELISNAPEDIDPSGLVLDDTLRDFDATFVKQLANATAHSKQQDQQPTASGWVDAATSPAAAAALQRLAEVAPMSIPASAQTQLDSLDRVLVFEDRRDAPVVNERHNAFTIYCSVPSLVNRELSADYAGASSRSGPSPKHKASAQLLAWVQRLFADRHQQAESKSSDEGSVNPSCATRLPVKVRALVNQARKVSHQSFASINIRAPPQVAEGELSQKEEIPCPASAHLSRYVLRLLEEERELLKRFCEVDTVIADLWEPMAAELIEMIGGRLREETSE